MYKKYEKKANNSYKDGKSPETTRMYVETLYSARECPVASVHYMSMSLHYLLVPPTNGLEFNHVQVSRQKSVLENASIRNIDPLAFVRYDDHSST